MSERRKMVVLCINVAPGAVGKVVSDLAGQGKGFGEEAVGAVVFEGGLSLEIVFSADKRFFVVKGETCAIVKAHGL